MKPISTKQKGEFGLQIISPVFLKSYLIKSKIVAVKLSDYRYVVWFWEGAILLLMNLYLPTKLFLNKDDDGRRNTIAYAVPPFLIIVSSNYRVFCVTYPV